MGTVCRKHHNATFDKMEKYLCIVEIDEQVLDGYHPIRRTSSLISRACVLCWELSTIREPTLDKGHSFVRRSTRILAGWHFSSYLLTVVEKDHPEGDHHTFSRVPSLKASAEYIGSYLSKAVERNGPQNHPHAAISLMSQVTNLCASRPHNSRTNFC